MKKSRALISILVAALLMLGMAVPAVAEVTPEGVTGDLEPGESITVTKTVTTPEIPPLIDILLLEDETGSFWDDIDNLQDLAPEIWDAIEDSGADFTMGVAGFRDFAQPHPYTYPPYPWGSPGDWVYRLVQDLTTDKTAFEAGVDALTAGGGMDTPEAQLEALHYLATPGHAAIDSNGDGDTTDSNDTPTGLQPTWRPGAVRVVLLATDAGCHVNTDSAQDGGGNTVYWPGDSGTTSPAVTAGILNGEGIIVIGLTPGGATTIACVDTLAAGTGGSVQATTATGEDILEAIMAGLEELTTDVWWEVEADDGLTVELDPVVHSDVEGETTVTFTETITVDEEVWHCTTLTATVTFYANNYDVLEGGVVGEQTIVIHVVGPVEIDIKPGSFPNSINPGGKGVIPVAILGTPTFDVSTVDVGTVLFGPGGALPVHYALEDVDGDGDLDMILHFKTQETGIAEGDIEATLTANTMGGIPIWGTDSVRTAPPKGKK